MFEPPHKSLYISVNKFYHWHFVIKFTHCHLLKSKTLRRNTKKIKLGLINKLFQLGMVFLNLMHNFVQKKIIYFKILKKNVWVSKFLKQLQYAIIFHICVLFNWT